MDTTGKCRPGWRICTLEEIKSRHPSAEPDERLRRLAGRTLDIIDFSMRWPRCQINNECEFTIDADLLVQIPGCDFLDTGMKRSWCRHCGAVGHFDITTGKYTEGM